MNYAIIGVGGIGGYYGGLLAKAKRNVQFLLHSDYEFVKQNGLQIDSKNGDFHLNNLNVFNNVKNMNPADVIIVCLKTTNNHLLKSFLPHLVKNDSLVVLIQNGLGLESDLQKEFPDINIVGGMAFICIQKIGEGHIRHLDYGKLTLGLHTQSAEVLFNTLTNDLIDAGLEIEVAPDLQSARWRKLVWNIAYNGTTVVLNTDTKQLMDNTSTHQLVTDLMIEVMNGANACGIQYPIDETFIQQMLNMTENMAVYAPSMKLDFDHKREMEIERIYSRPITEAKKAGYEMKKTATIEQQLKFINSHY